MLVEIELPSLDRKVVAKTINETLHLLIQKEIKGAEVRGFDPRWCFFEPQLTIEGYKEGINKDKLLAWASNLVLAAAVQLNKREADEVLHSAERLGKEITKLFAGDWTPRTRVVNLGKQDEYIIRGPVFLLERIIFAVQNAALFQFVTEIKNLSEFFPDLEVKLGEGKTTVLGVFTGRSTEVIELPFSPTRDGAPVDIPRESIEE